MQSNIYDKRVDELKEAIDEIGMDVMTKGYTLADAIREGSTVTEHNTAGWTNSDASAVCALSAGYIAARARGFIK